MKSRNSKTVLAVGADIKSRFCVLNKNKISLSRDFGNLDDLGNFKNFKNALARYKTKPNILAYDMHPGYFSSEFSKTLKVKRKIAVQHHHAHIASVMLEKNINKKVFGVAFDGTGYGSDGNLWGGEFLMVDPHGFRRIGHLQYIKLPGGETAIKEPWRIAFSLLYDCFGKNIFKENLELLKVSSKQNYQILTKMIENNINTVFSSSAGRLFDAVSSILGICQRSSFEAEAPIKLENMAQMSNDQGCYDFDINKNIIGYKTFLKQMLSDLRKGIKKEIIARRFHNSLAKIIVTMVKKHKIKDVVLSGGVFQNKLLYSLVKQKIKKAGYNLVSDEETPVNDLGICLGQVYVVLNSKEK